MSDRPSRGPRPVGLVSLLALGLNGIVGVGIFFAPAEVARLAPGSASIAAFAWTAVAMVPVAIGVAILGARFDEDGGPVLYARAAFGELPAFVVGWLAYISSVFSCAAIHVGLTRAVADGIGASGALTQRVGAVTLLVVLAAVCAAGISVSARVWTALAALKLVPLLLLVAISLLVHAPAQPQVAASIAPSSWLRAALTITFTYQGFEIIPVIAGQVRRSERTIPLAIVGSVLLAGTLYVCLQSACVRVVPNLSTASFPLATAGEIYGGAWLGTVLRIGTSVSALGIAFGMVAMTPRFLSALASVSKLGFGLADVSARGTPLRALGVTVVLVGVLVSLGSLGELFTLSSIAVITQYGIGACALAVLAWRKQRGLSLRHAWPVVPTLLIVVALLSGATRKEWAVAALVTAVGFALRFARKR